MITQMCLQTALFCWDCQVLHETSFQIINIHFFSGQNIIVLQCYCDPGYSNVGQKVTGQKVTDKKSQPQILLKIGQKITIFIIYSFSIKKKCLIKKNQPKY